MAEKDKIFYWLKLKAEFMNGEIVDFLMSQKNGANYVVLYQMLCIKTINTKGELATQLGDILVPYNVEKIQRDLKWFDIDTVRVALELFKSLGLVYVQENGIIKISDFKGMVGSETYWAQLKRDERAEKEKIGQSLDNVQLPLISNISISKSNTLYEKEFEEIWSIYPNKQGKNKALKSYIKARKDGVEEETIRDGVERYFAYCNANGTDKKYISHGDTWFGNRRWTDEYEMKGASHANDMGNNSGSTTEVFFGDGMF